MENILQRFSCVSFLLKPPWYEIFCSASPLIMVKSEDMKRLSHHNHVHKFVLKKAGEDVDLVPSRFQSALSTLPWPWFYNLRDSSFKIKEIILLASTNWKHYNLWVASYFLQVTRLFLVFWVTFLGLWIQFLKCELTRYE